MKLLRRVNKVFSDILFAERLESSKLPSLVKEGWPRHQERCREATFNGADGVVRSTTDNRWLERTTPSAPAKEASRHFLCGRIHPSFTKEGSIWLITLLLLCLTWPKPIAGSDRPAVASLDSIGITVSDIDRSVDFFSKVLSFEKVADTEIFGPEYEHLQGLFGMRARVVRMKLGDESIELTEYLTPKGRPFPIDSRSNGSVW